MNRKIGLILTISTAVLVLWGCGKREEKPTPPTPAAPAQNSTAGSPAAQTPAQPQPAAQPSAPAATTGSVPTAAEMAQMAQQNQQTLAQMNQGKQIAAVTADTLKALLPTTLAGMARTDASAEHVQTMGVDMTNAEGEYQAAEGGAGVSLKITDVGNMAGPMRMGLVAWTMSEYSRETDNGYQKSMTYNGYKGMEEYNKSNQHGTLRIFVADRFIVEVDGHDMTMDTLKQALGSVDLKKVAGLATGS